MTDKRKEKAEERPKVGAGRAMGVSDETLGVPTERQGEALEDARLGSAVGGHEAGKTSATERATMDDERRG